MKLNLQRLVLLIFFVSLVGLNAQDWFVANGGNDGGAGTLGDPFETIQHAISVASPGNIITVAAGTYNEQVTVTESVDLRGPNYQVNPNTTARSAEAILSTVGNAFTISAGNTDVSIDGFKFDGGSPMTDGNDTNNPQTSDVAFSNNIVVNANNIYAGTNTSWKNLLITNNKFQDLNVTANSSAMQLINLLTATVTNNTFTNMNYAAIQVDGIPTSTMTGNTINTTGSQAIAVAGATGDATVENNIITDANSTAQSADKGAISLYGTNFTGTVLVKNNTISGGYNGITIRNGQNITGKDITVTGNSITGLTSGYAIYSGATTGTLNAPSNWYGIGDVSAVQALISGDVNYSPWLGNLPDAPHGGGNSWTFYIDNSNPDALDDLLISTNLLDGDIINVDGGTYTAIVINKEITLVGTNGATLQNGSPAITVSANNVVVDGFTFVYNTTDFAIYVDGDYSGTIVKNCTFNNFDGGGVNPGYGIDNEGPATGLYLVDATENNDWNGNGEPFNATTSPTGTGVTITQYVQFNALTLVSPVNSLSGVSVKPTLTWELMGADEYTVQIASSTDFVTDLVAEQTLPGTFSSRRFDGYLNPGVPLANNTKYYWRVVGSVGATDVTSSTYYFTTVSDVNISLWNPGDGMELYQYDPATFTWSLNQATGSLKFYVQMFENPIAPDYVQIASFETTSAGGGSVDFFYDNISDLTKTIYDLNGGQKYYWYVCAYYDDGSTPNVLDFDDRIVKYSSLFSFTTKGGAVTAYPSWPVGGYTIYDLQPSFYWYTMQYEPSANYTVMYSTDPTMVGDSLTVGVTEEYAGSNTYVGVGTTLDPSQTYYWQVRTRFGNTYKYSSVASFTTYDAPGLVPTAANLSYPTGGLEIYTTAPTFYWWTGGTGTSVNYQVQLSTDGGTTWPLSFGPTTSNYVQGSGLAPGQTYTWRVRSYITGPDEVFSTYGEFSVTGGLNSYPVATWPVGNPTVYSATPTLSWYMEGSTLGWTHYKVAISKKDWTPAEWLTRITTPDSVVHVTADMNETFYTFTSPLDYGSKYYWAVAAHDHPAGPYSDIAEGSFTIAGNDANVVQLNPSNNLITNTKSPTFTWYVSGSLLGVTHFRLTYSKTELFNAFVETVVTTTTSASVNAPLELGTTYWWYVELSYDNGATFVNPSSTWKFTVDPGASSVVPFAGSPARGITISSTSPVLSWYLPAQSTSALSYDIEIADNANFANAKVYNDVSTLNNKVETLPEGEYFWRVRSKTASSQSDYSAAASFKIGTVTDVSDQEEIPLSFSIDQNYPNPFNPSTTINYSIPNASFVTIKVYNMLGQEVKTLVNKEVAAGRFTVAWNGDNNYGSKVSSGTYIYQIISGNFVQSRKMILLK